MRSQITSITLFFLSSSECSHSEVSSQRSMCASTSARLSCIAVTVAFNSVVVSLIVEASVATLCSLLLILAISANRQSRLGDGSPVGPSSSCKGLFRVAVQPVPLKYFDVTISPNFGYFSFPKQHQQSSLHTVDSISI